MNNQELILALRLCVDFIPECNKCPMFNDEDCVANIKELAADRLEALLSENERLKMQNWEEYCQDLHEYHCPQVQQLQTALDDLTAKYKVLEQQKAELQQALNTPKKQNGYTEYAVEIHNEKGFNRPLDVFGSYEEAQAFCDGYDNSDLADDEWLSIVFIDYNKDGNEFSHGVVN